MVVNHIEVTDVKASSMKARVRLFGILVGTFRKRVSASGRTRLYLPGGMLVETADGWKTWEPIKVFYQGRFVNKELKLELLRLSRIWWARHKQNNADQVDEKDLASTEYADRPWTEPAEVFVRPLAYVTPEEAERRPWDAGSLEIVLRDGDFEATVKVAIRRRTHGLEATLPKWTIEHSDTDALGNTVERKEYVPRLHFQVGGHYVDGQLLGAAAVLWAIHFRVQERLLDRRGRCASCRFLEYRREEIARDHDRPVEARWFCRLKEEFIDEPAATAAQRMGQETGMDRIAQQVVGSTRFVAGCNSWSGKSGQADFKRLLMIYRSRPKGRPIEEILDGGIPTANMLKIKNPAATFIADGFKDPEGTGSDVPDVPVTVRLLVEEQAGSETTEATPF